MKPQKQFLTDCAKRTYIHKHSTRDDIICGIALTLFALALMFA